MARKRKQRSGTGPSCRPAFSSSVVALAEAFACGQDCGFALHDALLECGRDDLASHFRSAQAGRCCRPGEFCLALDAILPARLPPGAARQETPVPADKSQELSLGQVSYDLEKAGVAVIEIEYDGCGDSGQIESIAFLDKDGQSLPQDRLPRNSYRTPHRTKADLETALDALVCDLLPAGWENNDGAYGMLSIDVLARKARLSHHDRYIATYNSAQELDLS